MNDATPGAIAREPLSVRWVKRGEFVAVTNIADAIETLMVISPCAGAPHSFYCDSCRAHLANVGNLIMHLDSGGEHRIVTWCRRHGVFEAAAQEHVNALADVVRAAAQESLPLQSEPTS